MEDNNTKPEFWRLRLFLFAVIVILVTIGLALDFSAFRYGWAAGFERIASLPPFIHMLFYGYFFMRRITWPMYYISLGIIDLAGLAFNIFSLILDPEPPFFIGMAIPLYLFFYFFSITVLRNRILRGDSGRPEKDKA